MIVGCLISESMPSMPSSVHAKARMWPFSTANKASVHAFMSFFGFLAAGKRSIEQGYHSHLNCQLHAFSI